MFSSDLTSETAPLSSRRTARDENQASEPVPWQLAMKRAIRSAGELRQYLSLGPDRDGLDERFPTFVPLELASRINSGDPDDPVLRQVLPVNEEFVESHGFVSDPVGDLAASHPGGVLHKYHGRALIVTNGACAVHCRYCFRREFPYQDLNAQQSKWSKAIEYVRNDNSIEEVLLSGGDPLTLADESLTSLVTAIERVDHVRRLRIHTRLPIVIPQRVTDALVDRLASSRLAVWIVVHTNHRQEIDRAVSESLVKLRRAGLSMLNQSVLLAGVNDNVEALVDLSKSLVDIGVQPYYLHQLDRVRGASHFWVPPSLGVALVEEMRKRLPGYAVPTYVVEEAGEESKTIIDRRFY